MRQRDRYGERGEELGEDEMDLSRRARQDRDDEEWEAKMLSVGAKIKQIAGLAGTSAVDERTSDFITSVYDQSNNGAHTSHLSDKQVEWVEDIHRKHFGESQ